MKIKLVESNFNEKTGISTVTINTDIGTFTGKSRLHDEDRSISSSFAGCQYAETKAIILYLKRKIKLLDQQIKGLEDCKRILESKKNYDHNSIENRTIRKQIYLLKKKKTMIIDNIHKIRDKMLVNIEKRSQIIKKIQKKEK